ncbi:hypothetical protein [Tissierella sp. Yu-01]|uniref:exodeoxyribonuclease X C-terminal domain-containing protein n=1 Tax=Tissierella sp. Yu-01 TaxID=3035694 RepID=UPI00240D6DFD|nr:hypothetical protein [Tissierella sp. Yu-01]WFA10365.1 hypothetical protein P3962_07375 [Tissierella sp. Yu-01]
MNDNLMMSLIESVEVSSIVGTLNKITQVQAAVQKELKQGHDYDTIPGTSKPTLLKPGAEKLLMMFGLTSEYEFLDKIEDYDKGIFAYTMKCILSKNGQKITEGVGSCNSKENKYRWRWTKEEDLPAGVDKESLKSKTNNWGKTEYQMENDEIYSQANTILKMAKKRAQVDATLTVASLSEVFTQDMEDMKEFVQQEQISTMTEIEAHNLKLTFGKHKGKTLGEVHKSHPSYIEWLVEKATDEVVRKAAAMLLNPPEQSINKTAPNTTTKENVDMDTGELHEEMPLDLMQNPFDDGDIQF